MTAIDLSDVSKAYDGNPVLIGVDLAMEEDEILAIIGPSGVGKTTLLRLASGLERPDSGTVAILGRPLTYDNGRDLPFKRHMAFILQKPVAFKETVSENVAYGLKVRDIDDTDDLVAHALEAVGLAEMGERMATRLSGGEMQRMAFARATVFEPSILLLDEFTANLDPQNVGVLERAVIAYQRERNATVVIVTHNLFQARRISTRTTLLLGGRLVETGPTERIFEEPEDERTRAFVSGEMVF